MNTNNLSAKLKISKVLRSLLVVSTTTMSLIGDPQLSAARTLPAHGGSSAILGNAGCWSTTLLSPTVTNAWCSAADWYMPLTVEPGITQFAPPPGYMYIGNVTVVAQGASPSNNVGCVAVGHSAGGSVMASSGWVFLSTFGVAASIPLVMLVPSVGTGMVDCNVSPNGNVIEVIY